VVPWRSFEPRLARSSLSPGTPWIRARDSTGGGVDIL